MKKKKHLSQMLNVEIKPLDKDSEGNLVGGFDLINVPSGTLDSITNNGCKINNNCTTNNDCKINNSCTVNNGCTINNSCTINNNNPSDNWVLTNPGVGSLYAF